MQNWSENHGVVAPAGARPRLTDWPEAYIADLRQGELWEAPDDEVLACLTQYHEHMRFGQYLNLNIQKGFYLRAGDGQVTKPAGSDSGFLIGMLSGLGIEVQADGTVAWHSAEIEEQYVTDGPAMLAMVLRDAKGPWMLTAEYTEGRWDGYYQLIIRFMSVADERAFLAAFPEAGQWA